MNVNAHIDEQGLTYETFWEIPGKFHKWCLPPELRQQDSLEQFR